MRIICGTDFSVHAAEAATVAAAFAVRLEVPLALVHSVEPGAIGFLEKDPSDKLRAELQEKLSAQADRLRKSGANVTEELVFGAPDVALVDAARRLDAGLIVVSSLGQVALRQWVVGSVAERTAQSAPVPTLVVRDHKPLLAWARDNRTLRILAGYDFSASADAALDWVSQLMRVGRCALTVAWVSWPPAESWRLGIGGEGLSVDTAREITRLLERDLKERTRAILGRNRAKLRVVSAWGGEEAELIKLAKADRSDLIVVGTNQRRGLDRFWLGSVSRGVLNHATMNVACVPMSGDVSPPDALPVFKRVLVPTDFSKLGDKAVCFAFGVAQRGGEVCLLHVVPPVGALDPDSERQQKRRAEVRKSVSARLQALIPRKAQTKGVRATVEVVENSQAAAAICQAAERIGADLICMGSRGRSTLKKKWLGSTLEAVMLRSSRPVLVIR